MGREGEGVGEGIEEQEFGKECCEMPFSGQGRVFICTRP